MNFLIAKAGALPFLIKSLEDGTFDRQLLASCIRSTGEIGEKILIEVFLFIYWWYHFYNKWKFK